MDFTEYDRIDDFELNEILWRADQGQRRTRAPGRAPGDCVPARAGEAARAVMHAARAFFFEMGLTYPPRRT